MNDKNANLPTTDCKWWTNYAVIFLLLVILHTTLPLWTTARGSLWKRERKRPYTSFSNHSHGEICFSRTRTKLATNSTEFLCIRFNSILLFYGSFFFITKCLHFIKIKKSTLKMQVMYAEFKFQVMWSIH